MGALYRASIWHPDAIPPDEWKYRSLKRVWLPVYDVIVVLMGIWALGWGSRLLNELFAPDLLDALGFTLASLGAVCFLGVAFPRLYVVEIVGKTLLIGMLGGYAAAVWATSDIGIAAGFVVWALTLGLPLPLFRLGLLGEEIKERREDASEEAT